MRAGFHRQQRTALLAALLAGRVRPGIPAKLLGPAAGGDRLEVEGSFAVPLDELAATHQGTLPALFG